MDDSKDICQDNFESPGVVCKVKSYEGFYFGSVMMSADSNKYS